MKLVANFKDRLVLEMTRQGLRQTDLCKMTGIPKSSMNKYVKGVSEPNNKNSALIAKALHVNFSRLLGYDVPKLTEEDEKLEKLYMECFDKIDSLEKINEKLKKLDKAQIDQISEIIDTFIKKEN